MQKKLLSRKKGVNTLSIRKECLLLYHQSMKGQDNERNTYYFYLDGDSPNGQLCHPSALMVGCNICLAALRFQEIFYVSLQLQEEGALLITDIFLEH